MQEHRADAARKCKYMGPMTKNQLKTLFYSIADTVKTETGIINCVLWGKKLKLREVIRHFQGGREPLDALRDVWNSTAVQIEQNGDQQDQEQVLIVMKF